MRIAITGGTGLVGRFIVEEARAAGDDVTLLSRTPVSTTIAEHIPYALGERPDLSGYDALIHCAFSHLPGRYRGGEGDDPDGFIQANLHGSLALFDAARIAGVPRIVFLSSRAVYGAYPTGTELTEALPPKPDTLYGQVKYAAEQWLAAHTAPDFATVSLRATGVYGAVRPGQRHKWAQLFDDFRAGGPIPPRRGTEVHGADLASAVRIALTAPPGVYNVSDILLDRHDLLAMVAAQTACPHPLPDHSDTAISEMRCDRLRALGWNPGGMDRLKRCLPDLLAGPRAGPGP